MRRPFSVSLPVGSATDALASLPRDTRLAGRTAVVTGSSSGIGQAIARVLAASGAVCDFAAEATAALGGRVDVVVSDAGICPAAPTAVTSDADLEAVWSLNTRAPHVLVAALAPAMAERGSGSIVTIGSWMARTGVPFGAIYTASKAAAEQSTRTWAAEYGQHGVRVNTVAPGATATPGHAGSEAALAAMTATTPAGSPVRQVDIASTVRWLVSDEAAFVHGALLDVDGAAR